MGDAHTPSPGGDGDGPPHHNPCITMQGKAIEGRADPHSNATPTTGRENLPFHFVEGRIERGRIRTYVEISTDLQSAAFNHSATLPVNVFSRNHDLLISFILTSPSMALHCNARVDIEPLKKLSLFLTGAFLFIFMVFA